MTELDRYTNIMDKNVTVHQQHYKTNNDLFNASGARETTEYRDVEQV